MKHSRIKQISSGSSAGNSYLYKDSLLIDVGVARVHIEQYLQKIKVIFISHSHQDHAKENTLKSIAVGSKRYKAYPKIKIVCGEWMKETLLSYGFLEKNIIIMEQGKIYNFGLFKLSSVVLYHDVPNYGLRFIDKDGFKGIYLSDTVHLDGIQAKDYDLMIVEYNHCAEEMDKHIQQQEDDGVDFIYEKGSRNSHLNFQKADEFINNNAKEGTEIHKVHLTNRYNEDDYELHYIYKEGIT